MKPVLTYGLLTAATALNVSFTQHPVPDKANVLTMPASWAGKQIVSTVTLKQSEREPAVAAQAGASVMVAGPSDQMVARILSVKKDKSSEDLLLEQVVKRVQMTIVSPLGRSNYDSDNTFERDPVTAALGQRYDPYINKPYKAVYRSKTGSAEQVGKDPRFDNLWTMHVPNLQQNTALQGVLLAHLPAVPTQGTIWTDSIRIGEVLTINRYEVLSRSGDVLRLHLDSQLGAGSAQRQTSSAASSAGMVSASSTVSAVTYQGELQVRQDSGFIEELRLTKKAAASVNAGGQTLHNNTDAVVVIQNKIN